MPQGLQTGGAKSVTFAGAGQPAHIQRLVAQAMPFLQQHQGDVVQVVDGQRALRGQRMLARYGEQERLVEQGFHMQLVIVDGQGQQRGVQPALAQALQQRVGLLLDQQHLQPRELLAQTGQHVRQEVGTEGREHAQPERAGIRILAAAGDLRHLVQIRQHLPCTLDDVAPHRGQHDLARRTFEQRHAQLLLQLADLGGEGRLADEAGGGGAAEVAVLGQGYQVFEVAKIHGRAPVPPLPARRGMAAAADRQAAAVSAAGTAVVTGADSSGAGVRIRWSNALSAAVEPAPIAITICL